MNQHDNLPALPEPDTDGYMGAGAYTPEAVRAIQAEAFNAGLAAIAAQGGQAAPEHLEPTKTEVRADHYMRALEQIAICESKNPAMLAEIALINMGDWNEDGINIAPEWPEGNEWKAAVIRWMNENDVSLSKQAYKTLLMLQSNSASPMQQAKPDAPSVYVECRECDECNHVGINDANDTDAACSECAWHGPSPTEDKCPSCEREGAMSVACPKCSGHYRLLADLDIASIQPSMPSVAPSETVDGPEFRKLVSDVGFAHQFGGFAQDVARLIAHIDAWHAAGIKAAYRAAAMQNAATLLARIGELEERQAKPLSDAVLLGKFNSADTVIDGLHEVQRAILASQEKQA